MYVFFLFFVHEEASCEKTVPAPPPYVRHTNNWAVLVDTSRFWFNYRHIANALSLYHSVKKLGIPDSQIVLMLADGMPCNARNCFPGRIFNRHKRDINIYGTNVEVDYRGNEVSVENFIKVLTGRHEPGTPSSQRLDSDEHSNVFVYMTGHGGDEFLKFQDYNEISSPDIADAIQEMHVKKRYKELFFMVDTCQAGTLANSLTSPNVVTVGSSKKDENSYAHNTNPAVGVSLIDRFTSATLDFLEDIENDGSTSLAQLFDSYKPHELFSTPEYRTNLFERPLDQVPVSDFFGSLLEVSISFESYPLVGTSENLTPEDRWILQPPEEESIEENSGSHQQGNKKKHDSKAQVSNHFLFMAAAAFPMTFLLCTLFK